MKMLVCDDNFTSLEVLNSMLQSITFNMKAVTSGKEALRELDKETKQILYVLFNFLKFNLPK